MGFFHNNSISYTPERTPSIQPVRPKTHTPASTAQDRGLRFYNPLLGRWISRDPIVEERELDHTSNGEIDRIWDIYAFAGNQAISRYDIDGRSWAVGLWWLTRPLSSNLSLARVNNVAKEAQRIFKLFDMNIQFIGFQFWTNSVGFFGQHDLVNFHSVLSASQVLNFLRGKPVMVWNPASGSFIQSGTFDKLIHLFNSNSGFSIKGLQVPGTDDRVGIFVDNMTDTEVAKVIFHELVKHAFYNYPGADESFISKAKDPINACGLTASQNCDLEPEKVAPEIAKFLRSRGCVFSDDLVIDCCKP